MQRSGCFVEMGNKALLLNDSTHKLYCSKVHFLNQQQWQFGPPVGRGAGGSDDKGEAVNAILKTQRKAASTFFSASYRTTCVTLPP